MASSKIRRQNITTAARVSTKTDIAQRRAGRRRCWRGEGMLRPDRDLERVHLHRAPIDMSKQIDGPTILARNAIQQDPSVRLTRVDGDTV